MSRLRTPDISKRARQSIPAKRSHRERGQRSPHAQELAYLLQQGKLFHAQRNFPEAARCYREALEHHPNHPEALHLFGKVALAAGEVRSAIELFKRALAPRASDIALRLDLADAYIQNHELKNAQSHLRRVLKVAPDNPSALSHLANCKFAGGDIEASKEIYESVLARFPEFPQATFGYAHLCIVLGRMETAASLYRKALGWGTSRVIALIGLASCERISPDSNEAAEIERFVEMPGRTASEYLGLRFAAGRIAEDAGRYDDAFRHFSEARKLAGVPFDLEGHRRVRATFTKLFTPAFFASRQDYGDHSLQPVFVFGMPRSGTTLTEQILSSHPEVAGAGERGDIWEMAKSLGLLADNAEKFARNLTNLSRPQSFELANRYLSALNSVSGSASRVVDKMPDNYAYLGLIALLLPSAKLIHCRRDPLDTCVSCFTTQMAEGGHFYANDLATLGAYYRDYVSLMDHWHATLPLPIFDSSYEQLLDAPEEQSRKLIDFVGLPWDSAVLAFHETKRAVKTNSPQVRQPLYKTSLGRWRRYAKHLGPLRSALGDLAAAD
jgi:tetratricopeptide (TPR) repeat protein